MQNIAGRCQQTLENKKFVDITQQCFVLLPQVNFPANDLNFHWRWWDQIQTIFLNLFYFNATSWLLWPHDLVLHNIAEQCHASARPRNLLEKFIFSRMVLKS